MIITHTNIVTRIGLRVPLSDVLSGEYFVWHYKDAETPCSSIWYRDMQGNLRHYSGYAWQHNSSSQWFNQKNPVIDAVIIENPYS